MDLRTLYLTAAEAAVELVADELVARAWDDPSSLDRMSVGALAAHTLRAVLTVERYLDADQPSPDATVLDAAGYVVALLPEGAPDAPVNVGVRSRADEGAEAGHAAVVAQATAALERLGERLPATDPELVVAVKDGLAITLDEYLVTRLVELVVHGLDLTDGLDGLRAPDGLGPAGPVVVGTLAEIARRRRSTATMVRALARTERLTGTPPRAV